MDLGKCGKKLLEKHEGEVSEVGSDCPLDRGRENKRLGQKQGPKGPMKEADSIFPRQEGPPFPGDKGPLVEDRKGLESDPAPERPLGISEPAASRDLAGTQRAVFWGWGHRVE